MKLRKFLFVFVVLGGLVFFNNYLTDQFLKSTIIRVSRYPMGQSFSFLNSFKNRLISWFRIDNIILENQALSQENRRLFALSLKMPELEKENELLRKELGVAEKRKWQVEIARVFQLNTAGGFSTALIDKGSDQGLKPGMAVVFEGDVFFGIVSEVFSNSAVVFLSNDPRVKVNVKLDSLAGKQISARAKGALDDGLILELVANQEIPEIGELVLTSGLDSLPSMLIVGKISGVKKGDDGLFGNVKAEPAFKNFPLENVFVLKL